MMSCELTASEPQISDDILDAIVNLFPTAFFCDPSFAFQKLGDTYSRLTALSPPLTLETFCKLVDEATERKKLEKQLISSDENGAIYHWRQSVSLTLSNSSPDQLKINSLPTPQSKEYNV